MPSFLSTLSQVALLTLAVSGAQADHDALRQEVLSGRLKPLAEILQTVQQQHPGRVMDVELERDLSGRRWYEIKLMDQQLRKVYVDAVTGQEIARPDALPTDLLSMTEVILRVQRERAGVVLKAELETPLGAAPYYELQWLDPAGREALLRVDARSGEFLLEPPVAPALAARLRPLTELLPQIEARFAARATEAELKVGQQPIIYYEIDLQREDGREIEVHVDAFTGDVLATDELF